VAFVHGMQGGMGPMKLPTMVPTQKDVFAAWGDKMLASSVYAKCTKVHAKLTTTAGEVTTIIDGVTETVNSYAAGCYLVENVCRARARAPALAPRPCASTPSPPSSAQAGGEQYAVEGPTFKQRYLWETPEPASKPELAREGFQLFQACGRVWAYRVSRADCEEFFPSNSFMAPWGEPMRIEPDDYLRTCTCTCTCTCT